MRFSRWGKIQVGDDFVEEETMIKEDKKILAAIIRGVDIMEIYSPVRVAGVAARYNLQPGESIDLRTGWDLSKPEQRAKVKKKVKTEKPYKVICSPPCTKFSRLVALNLHTHVDDPEWPEQFHIDREAAKVHVRFCIEIMKIQMGEGRYFLYEHPAFADGWEIPEMEEFL